MTDRDAIRRLVAELDDKATALLTILQDLSAEDVAMPEDEDLAETLETLAAAVSEWQEAKGYI